MYYARQKIQECGCYKVLSFATKKDRDDFVVDDNWLSITRREAVRTVGAYNRLRAKAGGYLADNHYYRAESGHLLPTF